MKGTAVFKESASTRLPILLAALINCLRDSGSGASVVRLQPPYGALMLQWVRKTGGLGVTLLPDNNIDVDSTTRKNLEFLGEERELVTESLRCEAGEAVLASLISNGIGRCTTAGDFIRPQTPAEFAAIPALQQLNDMLLERSSHQPNLTRVLDDGGPNFQRRVWWEVLLACRHFEAHIYDEPVRLVQAGWTAATVADAASAAAEVLAKPASGCFDLVDGCLKKRSA